MANFLHRPQGTDALPTEGSVARPEDAVRAVLRTADGGVLVTDIKREPDGSFSGEVYGVTPRQRQVAVGERVRFGESQIFTYKTSESASPADVERAEMIRAFGEAFRNADAPGADRTPLTEAPPPEFSLPPAEPPAIREPVEPTLAPPAEASPRSAAPVTPQATEPELSVEDAYAILGGLKDDRHESREERVEPAPGIAPVADQPPLADQQPLPDQPPLTEPAAPAEPDVREPIACLECAAPLPVAAADVSGQEPAKVSCASCGRINDVALAAAATRRRRQLHPSSDS